MVLGLVRVYLVALKTPILCWHFHWGVCLEAGFRGSSNTLRGDRNFVFTVTNEDLQR